MSFLIFSNILSAILSISFSFILLPYIMYLGC
nr:MAG TPA: hypothetical protein [Caudoviricetes sp.]